jgi:hypothetical protein
MILNISGRTDIVAFYSEWLINRLEEGFIDVRNPFNPNTVSRIILEDVDLLFFCTKNPIPILDKLKDIDKKDYCYDEKTKVLSILISDQITNKVMRKDLYTYFPEDYKKLENGDNIYFSRYKKFYEELNKFICRFV